MESDDAQYVPTVAPPQLAVAEVAPEFLERNAHVHEWLFGAVAELIDNSADAGSSSIRVDMKRKNHPQAGPSNFFCVTDDGKGIPGDLLQRVMIDLGRTTKTSSEDIGQYGVGFKSGSMRIGRDCLVMTQTAEELSVGLLSQTWLHTTGRESVEAPIVSWSRTGRILTPNADPLLEVLRANSYLDLSDIVASFQHVFGACVTGTHVQIWNLNKRDGAEELRKSGTDIVLRSGCDDNNPIYGSLRAYLEVIYLEPKVEIKICSKLVDAKSIPQLLTHKEKYRYNNIIKQEKEEEAVLHEVRVGFSEEARSQGLYGIFAYHRNRLIKAYWDVIEDPALSGKMAGIIGVADVSEVLRVMHNKQEFSGNDVIGFKFAMKDVFGTYWQKLHKQLYPQIKPRRSAATALEDSNIARKRSRTVPEDEGEEDQPLRSTWHGDLIQKGSKERKEKPITHIELLPGMHLPANTPNGLLVEEMVPITRFKELYTRSVKVDFRFRQGLHRHDKSEYPRLLTWLQANRKYALTHLNERESLLIMPPDNPIITPSTIMPGLRVPRI